MDLSKLNLILTEMGQPAFRYKQVVDFYYQNQPKSWHDVTVLSKQMREDLTAQLPISTVAQEAIYESDDVIKIVFKMMDGGQLVEGVVMKHKRVVIDTRVAKNLEAELDELENADEMDGTDETDEPETKPKERRTLCLSCQAGCPMGCYFCATGTMGLKKNLTAYEIADMAVLTQGILKDRGESLTNIVYMGMGEPFANYIAVKKSIQLIHENLGLGWRRLTVSTCGIVPKIMEFAKDFPQVNLAISLHAASNFKRSKLMPVNDRFNLETLMNECAKYVELTNRKLFFEYLVIDEFNDKPEDIESLKNLFNHKLYHLNLIRFHATTATKGKYGVTWQAPKRETLNKFMLELKKHHIPFTLRRSFGERLDAACGMLALKEMSK